MVLGKYRIEAELSRGGMGSVYRARHEVLDRPVAIKLLRPEMTTNDELLVRFVNEAKAASAIRHPSIIEVFDFGHTQEGQAYLVMELLDGETLAARLARGRLPEPDAVRITQGIAAALGAAHAKGIIHRDLKPENVFLVPDPDLGERAKVLDFGIAKLSDQASQLHTRTGALMGTPLYMAPEQARSAGLIDHRADLYSLGCILYELLTGRPPLVGEGSGEIIALHLFTEPAPPSTLVPVTPALERIVMRLLDKEPAARFSSASDLVDALDALTRVQPVTPPDTSMRRVEPAPSQVEARPPASRGLSLPLLAAGFTLAIAAIVAIVVALGGPDEQPAAPKLPPPVKTKWQSPVVDTGVKDVVPLAPVHIEPIAPLAPPPVVPARPARPGRPSGAKPAGSSAVRNTDKASPIEIEP